LILLQRAGSSSALADISQKKYTVQSTSDFIFSEK